MLNAELEEGDGDHDGGVEVGGAGAEGDEGVHIGSAAADHSCGAGEEGGTGVDEDGGGEDELCDGEGDESLIGVEVHEAGHGEVDEENWDSGEDAEPEAMPGDAAGLLAFFFDVFDGFSGEVFEDSGVVAGVFDGLDEGGEVWGAFDLGHSGGEVDGGAGDAGGGAEGLVDACGTGAAVHAFDVESDHGGPRG